MNCRLLFSAAFCAAFLSLRAEPVRISVDAERVTGQVNPLHFGANIEAADDRGIFSRPLSAALNLHGVAQGEGTWNPAENRPHPSIVAKLREMRVGNLRYPGGCLAHGFDWRKAVGSPEERGDWKFGVDEYIRLCRELGAEPFFTLTDYALPAEELPEHLAQLVEYLNAPATPEFPWAMKRAAWGNIAPYFVRYFELGNESSHGSHNMVPHRQYTPEAYAEYFLACAKAMRAVDPSVQLGLVLDPGTGEEHDCAWNRTVLSRAGAAADFVVLHFYAPRIADHTPEQALGAALAFGAQAEYRLGRYRALIRELAGKDLPLAMTEFNVGSTGNKPHPWRFSRLAGLMNADLQRVWMEPANHLLCADYWQVINGYWGSFVSDAKGEITLRRAPMAFMEVWGRYTGSELVGCSIVNAPRLEAGAISGLTASRGDRVREPEFLGTARLEAIRFDRLPAGITGAETADGFRFQMDGYHGGNVYPEFAFLPRPDVSRGFRYRISFEAKYSGPAPAGALKLGVVDRRGWDRTSSAAAIAGLQTAVDWKSFSGEFQALADSPGTNVLLRVENVTAPFTGTLEIRKLKFDVETELVLPAYPALTALASRNGDALFLVVFNKDPYNAIEAEIDLGAFQGAGTGVVLIADPAESVEDTPKTPVVIRGGRHTFPPASMTALEFRR